VGHVICFSFQLNNCDIIKIVCFGAFTCLVEHFLTLGGFSLGNTLQLTHCADARDALCILGSPQMVKSPKVASGRKVNKHVDYHLLRTWLENCDILHDTYCRREWSIQLRKIRLIDVNACRVVQYPIDRTVEYLALSYVWGKRSQKCFSVGSKVEIVPATIRDAIAVTRSLRMQFLWVDSVCIDQKSHDDKPEQIMLMSAIYRGAYATIVALSGRCADSGLPRVNVKRFQKFPDTTFLQTSYTIDGICVGTIMPTLRQQIGRSTWATRAWTYQEALLSPRCIYFSQHQVYFECNIRQCCESIDDSASAFHSMTRENLSPLTYAEPAATLGRGVFRNPFFGYTDYSITQSMLRAQEVSQKRTDYREVMRPPKQDFRGLLGYDQLITHYSNRKMTNQSDGLNAVSGILQQLQEEYFHEKGFFYGIPCADIQLGLLWKFRTSRRRLEFPSWTWAGHHGLMLEAYPKHIPPLSWLPTPLKVCKADGGALTVLSEVAPELRDDDHLQDIQDQDPSEGPPWSLANNPPEHKSGHIKTAEILFVYGIVLRLSFTEIKEEPPWNRLQSGSILAVTPGLGLPYRNVFQWRDMATFTVANGIVYDECWRDRHTRNELNKHCDQMQDFLLVARDIDKDSHCRYHLLLLQEQCDSGTKLYSRSAVMCLRLHNPRRDFHLFDPRHMWVSLT
jgi:hypothetical protein